MAYIRVIYGLRLKINAHKTSTLLVVPKVPNVLLDPLDHLTLMYLVMARAGIAATAQIPKRIRRVRFTSECNEGLKG